MSKTFMTKHKTFTAIIAVSLALIIMLGGTFAWQNGNQEALNTAYSMANPGGRLHDDYVDITYNKDGIAMYETMTLNKDVYVENFTSLVNNGVPVYVRVRLDEYMEIGKNAGQSNSEATSLDPNATLDDKNSWTTHIMDNPDDLFSQYWNWKLGGETKYMPTFNKDKNSLESDINGIFGDFENTYNDYAGITDKFDDITELEGNAIYERNPDGTTKKSVKETHKVKDTLNATVISMEKYIKQLNDEDQSNDTGNFWVWDTDGWAYWANPILPDTATGLLLDEISRTDVIIDKDWFYAINVVAQFVTADDLGAENGTGFYDPEKGSEPTEEAEKLLDAIGVEGLGLYNKGGRLHNDFNGTALSIYAENYTDVASGGKPIYARIKLAEYMEVGQDAGGDVDYIDIITPNAQRSDPSTWKIYKGDDEFGYNFWEWKLGGSTVYLPTFNKDGDSLTADINGTYHGTDDTDEVYYDDYVVYTNNSSTSENVGQNIAENAKEAYGGAIYSIVGTEYYDDDNDSNENTKEGQYRTVTNVKHIAKSTLDGMVITMQEWVEQHYAEGDYWVYDTETGWAYWAKPIQPGTATGLLLQSIEMIRNPGEITYYCIYAEAQFADADDYTSTDNLKAFLTEKAQWSPSQTATNVAKIDINPGGRP